MPTPTLERIVVYPVKSLDPCAVESAEVRSDGGLAFDRRFAMVDESGNYVNGKNDRRVHELRSRFDPKPGRLTLDPNDGDPVAFDVAERDEVEAWLSAFFERSVELRRNETGGFPDDTHASGPTVVADATIEAVAGWFDGVSPAEMERRLRPNLVVSGVEPFWEDRLYAGRKSTVAFRVGDAEFLGSNPCQRCVVPTRDPDTGAETPDFRETFVERRRETLPEWAEEAWFDHHFRLMVNTFVSEATVGESIRVGDEVRVLGERPRPA